MKQKCAPKWMLSSTQIYVFRITRFLRRTGAQFRGERTSMNFREQKMVERQLREEDIEKGLRTIEYEQKESFETENWELFEIEMRDTSQSTIEKPFEIETRATIFWHIFILFLSRTRERAAEHRLVRSFRKIVIIIVVRRGRPSNNIYENSENYFYVGRHCKKILRRDANSELHYQQH